jgi:cell wall-associated NlpC family hydrolase
MPAEEPPAGASFSHADPQDSTPHTGTWRPPTEAELAELARGPAKAADGAKLTAVAAPPAVAGNRNAPDASNADESIKDRLLRVARGMLAVPYRYGGTTLWGLDCSGFVQKAFSFLDLGLPRTAREQFREGVKVSKTELSAGDLVFFRTRAKYASHVGIYLGDNRFIHASAHDRKVTIDSLDEPYYEKHYLGAKRLLPEGERTEN